MSKKSIDVDSTERLLNIISQAAQELPPLAEGKFLLVRRDGKICFLDWHDLALEELALRERIYMAQTMLDVLIRQTEEANARLGIGCPAKQSLPN